ncbi:MAG: hypothetical protein R3230_00745 [Nitrosopumilaceae archaeon]|nr:hypothetical protein [Nitrosopumilaceae archaeon]
MKKFKEYLDKINESTSDIDEAKRPPKIDMGPEFAGKNKWKGKHIGVEKASNSGGKVMLKVTVNDSKEGDTSPRFETVSLKDFIANIK